MVTFFTILGAIAALVVLSGATIVLVNWVWFFWALTGKLSGSKEDTIVLTVFVAILTTGWYFLLTNFPDVSIAIT